MDRKLRDMEGIELMAAFISAWVKYGMLLLFCLFSSVAHVIQRVGGKKNA